MTTNLKNLVLESDFSTKLVKHLDSVNVKELKDLSLCQKWPTYRPVLKFVSAVLPSKAKKLVNDLITTLDNMCV